MAHPDARAAYDLYGVEEDVGPRGYGLRDIRTLTRQHLATGLVPKGSKLPVDTGGTSPVQWGR